MEPEVGLEPVPRLGGGRCQGGRIRRVGHVGIGGRVPVVARAGERLEFALCVVRTEREGALLLPGYPVVESRQRRFPRRVGNEVRRHDSVKPPRDPEKNVIRRIFFRKSTILQTSVK